ncbi:MAG: metalloregulator ArsR/SmtB family transcription factor [Sphingomonas sp.]|uniref:ArsR/SmtB family transcription factor n=1 Tax=Sphingomonas sp. TaxID=28214 RepID=UPI0026290377|nr:metalloregulator ArsR/SmtB family transcription factor [Sphingomonas sp.]MDK2768292.1 metalloregulator ArsR/SmtB family transcription factor [Sphingomonas sp.]
MTEAIMTMSALAQPTRLRVTMTLASEFPKGLPVGELAARVDTPQNTMSGHLAILSRAGLVATRRIGRIVEYRAEPGSLRSLAEFLLANAPEES